MKFSFAKERSGTLRPVLEDTADETPLPTSLVFPGLRVRFAGSAPILVLSGSAVAAAIRATNRRELINRLFSIRSLQSLMLNARRGEVRLDFNEPRNSQRRLLAAVGQALQGARTARLRLPHEEVILGRKAPPIFEIHRGRTGLTLWRIDAPSSRVFRLTHPLLRSDFVRKQVIDELTTLSDIVHRSVAIPLLSRESLLVFVRPHRMDPALFAEVLDPVLTRCISIGPAHRAPGRRDVLESGNLGFATVSDLVFPPLGVVNIGMTWLLNRGYIPHALSALERGKLTLEFLYLVIAGLTVITYEFLPSAIMSWFIRFWPRRAHRLGESRHARFLARYRHRPRRVWVERDGVSVETRVEELLPSSVVTLTEGDVVPGDGTIVGGSARINERLLTGISEHVARGEGSTIYAATQVVDGSVRMKIHALGEDTASARVAGWVRKALEQREQTVRSVQSAERTVLPVLATAAAGLIWGGFTVAKSVLRPDYVTGPAISEHMIGLATTMRAAHEGILISRRSALEKLIAPGCIVFDDSVAWRLPDLRGGTFTGIAQDQGLSRVVFFSRGPQAEAARLASHLGFGLFHCESSSALKREYIRQRQRLGESVVYVGDCVAESSVARQADLAIAVMEPPYRERSTAPIALLAPDLLRFLRLHALAVDVANEADAAFRVALVPNLAAVAGAFFFASPVLVSVLLTNLGTFANYVRSGMLLHLAEAETRV